LWSADDGNRGRDSIAFRASSLRSSVLTRYVPLLQWATMLDPHGPTCCENPVREQAPPGPDF
jgi:hypothetical protein